MSGRCSCTQCIREVFQKLDGRLDAYTSAPGNLSGLATPECAESKSGMSALLAAEECFGGPAGEERAGRGPTT